MDVGAGAAATQLGRSLEQGALQNTGRMLDVAVAGQGFFQVRLANGSTALTRDGNFHLDRNGRLVNSSGARVLPAITVPAGTSEDQVSIASEWPTVNCESPHFVFASLARASVSLLIAMVSTPRVANSGTDLLSSAM